MNKEGKDSDNPLTLRIPIIKADSETQTISHLVPSSPQRESLRGNMEQGQNLRKRRNLSKNRGQARQREKTPDPGRNITHDDTTTSDDEESRPNRSSREIEADSTYEEMKRMVLEKSNDKDPVYDLDTEEVLEARAMAATERRRRSISPFAVPDKEDDSTLEQKGSFIDPSNRLLSTTYSLTPKDEGTGRRSSLVVDTTKERRNSLTILTPPPNSSPKEKTDFKYPMSIPTTPKKLEEMVYPDEAKKVESDQLKKSLSPKKKENVFNFETEEDKQKQTKVKSPTATDIPIPVSGEIVTKVIQVERTPSKKLSEENKPKVDIRQRVVRTPSRKTEIKPVISKQINKEPKEEAPVRPPRSRSASRLGGKTSESEMSEDQGRNRLDPTQVAASRRRVTPTPRRFLRNKSPRANRSQSVNRAEDLQVTLSGTGISQTSKEIMALMQQARARSLSIPKDDPKLAPEYKIYSKKLATPNKTPTNLRQSRGISCPKTIQIISNKEVLQGIPSINKKKVMEKANRQSSGYIEASQSEYTSSCYSTSPSDNEHNFNLSERTAELTRKLNILSQEVETLEDRKKEDNIILYHASNKIEPKNVLRRRKQPDTKHANEVGNEKLKQKQKEKDKKPINAKSKWQLFTNWLQFREERNEELKAIILSRNKCICDCLLIIIMCGLGGLMFKTLEGSFENNFKCSTRNVKRDFIESLWRGSHHMREDEWKSMARRKLFEFEDQLHTAHEAGVTSYSGQRSWNFMNSFVYCLTLISTIGYGHIAPKTTYGRVATIVYAIIGIPLFLIVLADFGKLFTRIIKFFWAFIRRFYYTRSCKKVRRTVPVQEVMKGLNIVYDAVRRPSQIFNEEDMKAAAAAKADNTDGPPTLEDKPSEGPPPLPPKPGYVVNDDETEPGTPPSVYEIDDEFNLPISVAIIILIIYMIIGAVSYNFWESWSFLESFYFVFISMSTIGLGDLVPDHPMFMMASILYLIFGLALTSMCINVVQVKLSDTFKQASAKIGATIGLKVAEEDGSLVPITPPPSEIAPVHRPKKVEENNDPNMRTEVDLSNR